MTDRSRHDSLHERLEEKRGRSRSAPSLSVNGANLKISHLRDKVSGYRIGKMAVREGASPKGGRSAKTDDESVASLGLLLDNGKESARSSSFVKERPSPRKEVRYVRRFKKVLGNRKMRLLPRMDRTGLRQSSLGRQGSLPLGLLLENHLASKGKSLQQTEGSR